MLFSKQGSQGLLPSFAVQLNQSESLVSGVVWERMISHKGGIRFLENVGVETFSVTNQSSCWNVINLEKPTEENGGAVDGFPHTDENLRVKLVLSSKRWLSHNYQFWGCSLYMGSFPHYFR